ncbi:MAG: uroporphyrinogen decarboxylase family protein [Candidatus Zipacnadales bacterium]
MTQRERLLTALDRGQPDQVPVTWELVDRCALAFTGHTGWRAQCDAHRMIGSAIFNLQGVGPHLVWERPRGYREYSRPLGQRGGWQVIEEVIETPRGQLSQITHSGGIPSDPLVSKRVESFVKRPSDWEIMADWLDAAEDRGHFDLSQAELAHDYVGDDGLVNFWLCDSLYALANLRDAPAFLIDLMDRPAQMHELHEKMHRRTALGMEAFNASVADVLVFDICWASTSLLSPSLVQEFVLPEARWACETISSGKRIVFFTSGRIREVLPQLADCGPHGIQHLDVLGDCDLAEVKHSLGDRFCLMGNYNPVILAHGTISEAQAEARRCLRAAAEGGGYILTTSDEVPGDAKLANMQAVVKTVEEEGRY